MVRYRRCQRARVTLLPWEMQIPVLARSGLPRLTGPRLPGVSSSPRLSWVTSSRPTGVTGPRPGVTTPRLPLVACARLALALTLLALASALLAFAIALLIPADARLPVAVPARALARAGRLRAWLGRPVGCELPGRLRRAARGDRLRR